MDRYVDSTSIGGGALFSTIVISTVPLVLAQVPFYWPTRATPP